MGKSILNQSHPVRYIKLGEKGHWAASCIKDGTLRLGFWGLKSILDAAQEGRWEDAKQILVDETPTKTPTDALRQIRDFLEDDGRTTWITFHNRKMYYGKVDPTIPTNQAEDGPDAGFHRRLTAQGWSCKDANKEDLLLDNVAGHLGMVSQYRGTICAPRDEDYVLRRIRGEDSVVSIDAREAVAVLHERIAAMMGELTPDDFEVLVDMTFAASGWRRIGRSGGTEELIDLVLVRPAHGRDAAEGKLERIAVQVKLESSQKVFDEYKDALTDAYDHAYFVYVKVSGKKPIRCDDGSVTLFDANRLAPMVLEAGLTRWLIERVR